MKTKLNPGKLIVRIILILLCVICLSVGSFTAFLLLGKDETINLPLETIPLAQVPDGVYTGSYRNFRWSNTVEVTVKDHRILEISVIKPPSIYDPETVQHLTQQLMRSDQTDVDAVSGATANSKAFLKAVENALSPAVTRTS